LKFLILNKQKEIRKEYLDNINNERNKLSTSIIIQRNRERVIELSFDWNIKHGIDWVFMKISNLFHKKK